MAEIVGVIGSSVAIFDALQKFRRYVREVINAPIEREDFLNRLACVETVHRALNGSTSSSSPDCAWVKELSPTAEHSPVCRLLKTMEKMGEILKIDENEKALKKKMKNLKWHSEKKNLDAFFGQIKDHCISILVVMQWAEVVILKEIGARSDDAAANLAKIEGVLEEDRKQREKVDAVTLETGKNVEEGRKENTEAGRMTVQRLNSIEARLQAEEESKRKERERAERKEVEKWLSPLEFARRHQIIFENTAAVQKGKIGRWFFDCEEFKMWRQGKIRVLRGYGEPGAGKTILSSVVVEELTKSIPESPIVCVYLEKAERFIQTAKNIRGSFLKQLIQFRESGLSSAIRAAFDKASRTNTAPNDIETTQLLKAEIDSHRRVFLIIDGLDEASDETRKLIETDLLSLDKYKLSILIMSRKDDITELMQMHCDKCDHPCIQYYHCKDCAKVEEEAAGICIQCRDKGGICVKDATHRMEPFIPENCEVFIETPDDDIAVFLKSTIEGEFPKELEKTDFSSPRRGVKEMIWQCYHKPELFANIVQYIIDNSDGRFLLAREYIKHFRNKNTLKDIKSALKNRSKDGTDKVFPFYAEDMERIMKQEPEDAELARRVLSIVYLAKRNLTLVELQQALAVDDDDTEFDPDGIVHEGTILHVTKGLIAIDRNTSSNSENDNDMSVRFDHLTREEYFDKFWETWFPNGKVEIAKICLTFLGFDDFARAYDDEEEFQAEETRLPFISYAVQFWGDHVREAGPGAAAVVDNAVAYLKNPSRVGAYIQAAWTANTRHKDKWDVRRSIHPLHICAWFDLGYLIPSLNCAPKDIDVQEETHAQTPLMYACRRGNVETVRRLLEAGASVNKRSGKGRTALFEAIFRLKKEPRQNSNEEIEKSEQIVNLLLEKRSMGDQLNINVRNPVHLRQTALVTSIEWQQTNIACSILNHPHLNPNLPNLDGITPLHLAACNGLYEVVYALLKLPAIQIDLTEQGEGRTALHLGAKYSCHFEVIAELLKHGADRYVRDDRGGTAILRAVEAGKEKSFEVLVASSNTKADLTCVDEDNRTLAHYAAASGIVSFVKTLVETMPESIHSRDVVGMTPLHEACRTGQLEAAQLLLEIGGSLQVKDKLGRTPLTVAHQYGHSKLVKLLSDKSVDNKVEEALEDLPIWSLAILRQLDGIKSRISQSLCLNEVEPRTQRNALHLAVINNDEENENEEKSQIEILRELLATRKLSPEDVDKHAQTPLHIAAMFGNVEAAKLLLSHEADADMADRFGMTALKIACKTQHLKVAVALIEAGADIEDEHLDLNELLFAALREQNITAVQRLIVAGADRMAQDEEGRTPDMVAHTNSKLLGIIKSTKSYRFRATTTSEKDEINLDLLENTMQDADEMWTEVKGGRMADGGVSIDGKSARRVRFTPFASRHVDFKSEKESEITVKEILSEKSEGRNIDEVQRMLDRVSVKAIPPLPSLSKQPVAVLST